MQLEHQFSVPAPVDVVWRALLDPERVAPCMPGASLSGVEGDSFNGSVKVKLGPISLLYKGSGEFLEKDDAARQVVIKASGKDARGNGTAAATVTLTVTGNGAETTGKVSTDLSITGRPAQFGRGLIAEVGGKILDTFAANLAADLSRAEPAKEAPGEVAGEAAGTGPAVGQGETATEKPAGAAGEEAAQAAAPPRREAQPVDLLDYAGPSVVKRLAPLVLGALVVIFLLRRRRRRH